MKFRTLIQRNLRFHWRAHLGVVLGAAIGSAALIGALVVGDSVKGSLRERALSGLGNASFLLHTPDRYFSEFLPPAVETIANHRALNAAFRNASQNTLSNLPITINPDFSSRTMLVLRGTVSRTDAAQRINQVQVVGISDFASVLYPAAMTEGPKQVREISLTNSCVLNQRLAAALGLEAGSEIIIRFNKAASLSVDAAITRKNEQTATLRLRVATVATNGMLADFSPIPTAGKPVTVFIPLNELSSAAGVPAFEESGAINTWLLPTVVGWGGQRSPRSTQSGPSAMLEDGVKWVKQKLNLSSDHANPPHVELTTARQLTELSSLLSNAWNFQNVKLGQLRVVGRVAVLKTDRVFLDPPVARSALAAVTNAQPILTYLATLLRAGTNATPYSMVTAAGAPWTPVDLRDDEIVVSQWLADDLHVKPGDEIALSYFLPESGAKLEEATNTFRVRSIVPLEKPWADRTLMPDFPGIEKAESTRDWDAGFPLTYEIRKQDDDYWKQHRGTPKAFITLAAGQKMWGNRFGNLTAIRFPMPTNAIAEAYRIALEKAILANLKPEELGLRFEPVRDQALKAAEESQDFGGLFLGFSFFLIAAALLLMAMLFQFGLEQRAPEIGTLLALGFTPKQVRKLLVREGVVLAFIGGVLGAVGGIYFAKTMLHGLTTVWRDAVGATALQFHVTGQTLVIGLFASVVVSAITLWLALRKFVKREPRKLLAGETAEAHSKGQNLRAEVIAYGALVAGVALAGWAIVSGNTANAGAFFGAGALVLIAGLGFVSARLVGLVANDRATEQRTNEIISLGSLALRGCARRRKRSLGTVAMLACGSFLIVSIGVFRLDANRDATEKTSGAGGFALIGETTMPVVQDLNSQSGRDFFALSDQDMQGVSIVPFRVREGDEASCLNLNAAQKPRLLGVKPEALAGRFAFQKLMSGTDVKTSGWSLLSKTSVPDRAPVEPDEVPAIGDANSIQWAMKKKVGDTIDYVDERGQPFKVRIVGAVANSILQGQLIIDEAEFVKRFPGQSGYRMFLMDVPTNRVTEISATLSRAMQDVGLELTPAPTRLAQFNAVQNTYLGTFQVLGGLGLLLGSVGLGIVVLRNVLERRGELAVLVAVGFRRKQVQRLLLMENGALLAAGLGVGVIAAAVAVLPAVLSPAAQLPASSLATTLVAILLNGLLWTWVATRFAVRGDLLRALRNE